MNDEQMQPLLEVWLRDREAPRPKVQTGVARVMADVPRTRQQGRWWPVSVLDRPASTFPNRELVPAPIPATNGRQPARGFTMFSAVKFVVAGFIVALFGGFLLTGILSTPQGDEMAPAAVTASSSPMPQTEPDELPPAESTVLSFTMPYFGETAVPTVDFDEARRLYRGGASERVIDSGDPRLSGTMWVIGNGDTYMDSQGHVRVGIVGIENEDGTWRGTALAYASPHPGLSYHQMLLTGRDAYEGLSAILFLVDNGTSFDVAGMVFPGELPPLPEMPGE